MVLVPQLAHTVTKVDFYSTLVHKHIVHATICHDTLILCLKLHKCKLERIASLPVSDDLTGDDFAEAGENYLQVFALCHWVHLAYEQNIVGRFYISLRKVIKHCKNLLTSLGLGICLLLLKLSLAFALSQLVKLNIVF